MEWLRLRAQDIDFDFKNIRIWNDKGGKHRIVTPSEDLVIPLRSQIQLLNYYLSLDRSSKAFTGVYMPLGLRIKAPNSNFTVERHYLFPSKALSTDPESKLRRRQHINESSLRKVITMAQVNAKIEKRSPSHSASFVCDSFA